jgi:ADP-ribose pyrophosphatase
VKWFPLVDAVKMVFNGEIVNSTTVAGILAAHAMPNTGSLRTVDAPWPDRSRAFAERKADQ